MRPKCFPTPSTLKKGGHALTQANNVVNQSQGTVQGLRHYVQIKHDAENRANERALAADERGAGPARIKSVAKLPLVTPIRIRMHLAIQRASIPSNRCLCP